MGGEVCGSATGQTRRSSADAGRLPSHLELPISVNELAQRGVDVRPAAPGCGFKAHEHHGELGCAWWSTRRHMSYRRLSPPKRHPGGR